MAGRGQMEVRRPQIATLIFLLVLLMALVSGCTGSAPASTVAQTTGVGTVNVNATLNGSPWQGPADFSLVGPETVSGSQVPRSFRSAGAGTWTIVYGSGAPDGASLTIITPLVPQTLDAGGTITFNLHFTSDAQFADQAPPGIPASGSIKVNATLDGSPWQVPAVSVLYVEIGSRWYQTGLGGVSVPEDLANLPSQLTYKVGFIFSGRLGASFMGVSPPEVTLAPGGAISFTLRFSSSGCGGG
jgi:hypothetical protein